jgi:hypothetical protein
VNGSSRSAAARAAASAAPARMPVPARVRKRDGRELPFDRNKIERAIAQAQAAVGELDPGFPAEVAAVVELALGKRALERNAPAGAADEHAPAPSIEEIQDLVERALIELGRAAIAKAYILYRERRAQIRALLEVRAPLEAGGELRVLERDSSSRWSKGRIAAALMREAALPRATAEEVAARVERRVFDSGLRSISTGLVREFVDNELVELGLTSAFRAQEALKLPRHDLRRALAGEPLEERAQASSGAPEDPRVALAEQVSGAILRRYALEDVLGEELAERHRCGDLSVEDLGAPHLALALSLPSELVATGPSGPELAFESLEPLARACRACSRVLVLEDPGELLGGLVRGARSGSPLGLAAWLRSLCALARASGRLVQLGTPGARHPSLLARLVDECAQLERAQGALQLVVDESELEDLLASQPACASRVDALLGSGLLAPAFQRGEVRAVSSGLERRPRERGALALAGAVALHLPRAARRAGPWREDALFELLAGHVRDALGIGRALVEFQRALRGGEWSGVRAQASVALVPVGLREALATLGGGEIDPAQGARVLAFLREAAERLRAPGAPALSLCAHYGERAAQRFAALDAHEAGAERARQRPLFPAADTLPALARGRAPYALGYRLAPLGGWWPGEAEAELCASLPSGLLHPLAPAAGGPEGGEGALVAWRRFRARRARGEGHERGLLFPLSALTRERAFELSARLRERAPLDPDSGTTELGAAIEPEPEAAR